MRLGLHAVFLGLFAAVVACAPASERPLQLPDFETPPAPTGFVPGDKMEIRVYGEDKLTGEYQVHEDGMIDFPLVGMVAVGGRTQGDVAADLERALADGYLRNPQVTVIVTERQNIEVSVLGEVEKPGRLPYVDNLTLVQAVSAVGGLTEFAAARRVRLTRKGPDGPQTFEVSLRDITEGRREDLVLRAGDIVYVPPSPI